MVSENVSRGRDSKGIQEKANHSLHTSGSSASASVLVTATGYKLYGQSVRVLWHMAHFTGSVSDFGFFGMRWIFTSLYLEYKFYM